MEPVGIAAFKSKLKQAKMDLKCKPEMRPAHHTNHTKLNVVLALDQLDFKKECV